MHWPKGNLTTHREITSVTSYTDFVPTILDLCGISSKKPVEYDGIRLKSLLYDTAKPDEDRIIFTDTQREEFLVKWKQPAIMTNRWRLTGPNELYDLPADPAQKTNVASTHADVVAKLKAAYETWWKKVSVRASEYSYVKVGTPNEPMIRLNSHDFHTEKGPVTWSQEDVRLAKGQGGFWPIEVMKAGTYELQLRRWPAESGLRLNEAAPEGSPIPGGKPYPAGNALTLIKATIKLGDTEQTILVNPSDFAATFTFQLPAGKTSITPRLIDANGIEWPAYYAYIRRKN